MRRASVCALALLVAASIVGCQTRGVHTVPTTRDYKHVEKQSITKARLSVAQAHRVGAQHFSPYEYFSAVAYLDKACEEGKESDWKGKWDYSGLAQAMAEAAIAKGGIPDGGTTPMPADKAACRAEFDRLKARCDELDAEKAKQVSPVLYAHVVSALSCAEHELCEWRDWPEASHLLATVEPDINTIWAQDVDGDGICDMKDGAPWAPEDKDGFEDEDGVPDPDNDQDGILDLNDLKPMDPETKNRWHDYDGAPDEYPALEMIHFDSGSARLSADSQGYLRGLCIVMAEWPELKLHIAGHTDNRHTDEFNQKLSEKRAESVKTYLVEHGCVADQLVLSAHSESAPIEDNKTAQGMAKNRRVELRFE